MKTIKVSAERENGYVAALGFFDGIHLGHSALLDETIRIAREEGLTPAVLTFNAKESYKGAPLLFTEEEKEKKLLDAGINVLFIYDFDEISSLSPEVFVRDILIGRHAIRAAVVGPNFRFGYRATGTSETLATQIDTTVVPFAQCKGEIVSSTAIRKKIEAGDIETANQLLGRPFSLTGTVVRGKGLGHTWGFPTMNFPLPTGMVTPRFGVYVAFAKIGDERFPAVVNVGVRPSVETSAAANVECHILSQCGERYGETVTVELLYFLREEKSFPSVEALKEQIKSDRNEAKQWIRKYTQN